jgi:hypothetical protein
MSQRRNTVLSALRLRHGAALALAAVGLAACSADQVTAPGEAAPSGAPSAALAGQTPSGQGSPFTSMSMSATQFAEYASSWYTGPGDQFAPSMRPRPLTCSGQSTAQISGTIGTGGGVLQAGNNRFAVPSGALSASTAITVTFTRSPGGVRADLRPHGLKFAKPTTVQFDLGGCSAPGGSTLNVYYVDGYNRVMQVMPSTTGSGLTRALTDHFSGFIVGWGVMS